MHSMLIVTEDVYLQGVLSWIIDKENISCEKHSFMEEAMCAIKEKKFDTIIADTYKNILIDQGFMDCIIKFNKSAKCIFFLHEEEIFNIEKLNFEYFIKNKNLKCMDRSFFISYILRMVSVTKGHI